MEDVPSATFSVTAFEHENCHLRHFLLKTHALTGLLPEQLPVPSLEEVGDFILAESTILPLLCSMTYAMAATLKGVEKLCLETSDLEARVANSLPDIIDHSTQVNQIHSSLHDLSHRVAHLRTAQAIAPPKPQSSRPRPSTLHAPQAPPARGAPPQLAKGPTRSFAAIVGGTSKFDEAAQENMAAKKNKGKKKSTDNTSATKVTEAVKKASPPKAPTPLASAARRLFAPHSPPGPHPDTADIIAHLPDLAASVLREANCSLPCSLKAIINNRGSVTLIVVDTSVPAASYTPYFEAPTTKLNQSFLVGENPWLPFRLAPTCYGVANTVGFRAN